jgi:hypothetical protein
MKNIVLGNSNWEKNCALKMNGFDDFCQTPNYQILTPLDNERKKSQ